MIFFVDGLLWVIALALGLVAASRSRQLLRASVREGVVDCVRLLPRIMRWLSRHLLILRVSI